MNLEHRIDRLECALGDLDGSCPHGARTVYSYGEAWLARFPAGEGLPPDGPEICPTCGLKKHTQKIIIDYVTRAEEADEAPEPDE